MIGSQLRELAGLQRMAVPLPEAVEGVGWSQLQGPLRSGSTLGQAMQQAGKPFPPQLARVLDGPVAELPPLLEAAAQLVTDETRTTRGLESALRYTRIVSLALLLLMWALGGLVYTQFRPMLEGMPMPGLTQTVLRWQGPYLLMVTFLLGSVAWAPAELLWYGSWARTRKLACWLRWVDLLTAHGVSLPQACALGASAYPELGLKGVVTELERGQMLSQALQAQKLDRLAWLVRRAELQELRPGSLSRLAGMVDREVELNLDLHLQLLEPALLILLAGLLSLTLLVVFLPLYQLIGNLG